ncbi:zf-CCHC domain-containing protein, partial [Cephalotus follicularis]
DKGPCFHCGKPGHWKRNCLTFLRSIGKDSECGTHICSNLQALMNKRNLEKGEGNLRLADGSIVEAIVVGSVYIL